MGASAHAAWNNPYPERDTANNILYSAFRERPKHLDPARSYSSNEYLFIANIYEPPLQYDYLKRPYTLIPLTATKVPTPTYLDKRGRRLPSNAPPNKIAYSIYDVRIRPGIRYQPHPAFARDADGRFLYHELTAKQLKNIYEIRDFPKTGTRELTAADYVYQIKRLAHPKVHCPILSVMAEYIVGLKEYSHTLKREYDKFGGDRKKGIYLNLTKYPLAGAKVIDRYTYRIKLYGKYPQMLYWMAMPFFAPMAHEVDRFFSQPGMEDKNLTLHWYPVGTGPYMLTVNNPNRQMVLERNPNFHGERYPSEGEPEDKKKGLLADTGKPLPFIDKVVFSLEKEDIPYWSKFLQGYYDRSSIRPENFEQAIHVTGSGDTELTEEMQSKGIELLTSVAASTYYMGFNMQDAVVGEKNGERARKLRRAMSIAVNMEEEISIFRNGRGIPAQGPLPPGIFGHRAGRRGINPYIYDWVNGQAKRKSIDTARKLLVDAGYPDGIDAKTGKPLLIYFDTPAIGPEEKARLDWMVKQLKKINIQLVVRPTDYNRFQEKMRKGIAQLFRWGWNADYPDPENFLFLLYGPNKKVGKDGENAANYDNPEFNRLFDQMKNMDNGPERQAIIDKMVDIARRDAPWIWGLHPKNFILQHAWVDNTKPHVMANNTLKYLKLEPMLREQKQRQWNPPIVWPIWVLAFVLVLSAIPAFVSYIRREHRVQR